MEKKENTITITIKEYNELLESSKKLLALEAVGVDNWEGYDDAMDLLDAMED